MKMMLIYLIFGFTLHVCEKQEKNMDSYMTGSALNEFGKFNNNLVLKKNCFVLIPKLFQEKMEVDLFHSPLADVGVRTGTWRVTKKLYTVIQHLKILLLTRVFYAYMHKHIIHKSKQIWTFCIYFGLL